MENIETKLKYLNNMKSIINREELRRLEKAAKDKDKNKLREWCRQFEQQIGFLYQKAYEKEFKDSLCDAIDNFVLTIVYTLRYNENTKFGKKRINDFMEDLFVTIDMFRTGEYNPEEYREQLKKDGIIIKNCEEK